MSRKVSLPPVEEVPAAHLEGRTIANGWVVGPMIDKAPGATGGTFSCCYTATNTDGRVGFLKALNFAAARTGARPFIDEIADFSRAYVFERDLLVDCAGRKLSRIVHLLDHGEASVPEAGPMLCHVPYLIFEPADGDINRYLMTSRRFDCAWAFRVMKHTFQGVEQLHSSHAAHQDLKPSNILTQADGKEMKLGDLGRAERRTVDGPWCEASIPGAVTYAPPEMLYGRFTRSWEERRAADMYLAGSIGAHLFLGHCLTAHLVALLPPECHPLRWEGSFEALLPALHNAHGEIIQQLHTVVLDSSGDADLTDRFVACIQQTTNPDPGQRGHPKDRAAHTSSYDVRRYVSIMNMLMCRAEYMLAGRDSG